MTYKQFLRWCNKRACDGKWGFDIAISCCNMIDTMRKTPIWRRKKQWKTMEPFAVRYMAEVNQFYMKDKGETDGKAVD